MKTPSDMVRNRLLSRWLGLNLICFAGAFVVIYLVAAAFPGPVLRVFAAWTSIMKGAGAKTAAELASPWDALTHILARNTLSAAVCLLLGLVAQGPLIMVLLGGFHAMVASLAPITLGRALAASDWVLLGVEALPLAIAAALGSSLATDLFGLQPNVRGLREYWRTNWKRLFPQAKKGWRHLLRDWWRETLLAGTAIPGLLVLAAWVEVAW